MLLAVVCFVAATAAVVAAAVVTAAVVAAAVGPPSIIHFMCSIFHSGRLISCRNQQIDLFAAKAEAFLAPFDFRAKISFRKRRTAI